MGNKIPAKLLLITWKNFIIRRRHKWGSIFEIIIPILFFVLIAVSRSEFTALNRVFMNETTSFPAKTVESINYEISSDTNIFYTKNSKFYENLMEDVRKKLSLPATHLHGFDDTELLMYNYTDFSMNNPEVLVIVITFDDHSGSENPKKLKYSIRTPHSWRTDELFPAFEMPGPMSSDDTYYRTGFLTLQSAIDECFITKNSKKSDLSYEMLLQRFPYPPYWIDYGFSEVYSMILPLLTVLSFLFLCPSLLKGIVEEKKSGIKELMKLMGLESWMLWTGWLIHSLVVNIFSIIVIVLCLKIPFSSDPVIPLCNGFLLWFFLLLYVMASISFCFFMSTLFNRPTIAMCAGMLIWILSYFLLQPLVSHDPRQTFFTKCLYAIFPNICVYFGYQEIAVYEARDVGLRWSNFYLTASANPNQLSMGFIYLMLIFDIAFYGVLTWYIDNIMPGEYGLARPWYFPFKKSYWLSSRVEDSQMFLNDNGTNQKNYEQPSRHLKAGIKINNLRKQFGKVKAVDGLTMDIYNGEITALLGHNGAGKTTTMSILTGMIGPTSGDVWIQDYNIRTEINQIRDALALCPQTNMLFTDLTVIEHLVFFARLKGKPSELARVEAQKLLALLNLSDKSHNQVSTLSGGMKRKLSLAIALIGDAQVLMLDEPTSGMDPEARREVWDLLLRMRAPDKVIVVTTHFMEEADVLGDRIAIMDRGTLRCYGTSMFLKKKYGAGYQLSLIKAREDTDVQQIMGTVHENVQNATMKHNTAGLVTFTLPTDDIEQFPNLFQTLESSKSQLGISGIGLAVTTLEEVFLKVGEIAEEEHPDSHKKTGFYEDSVDGSEEKLILLTEKGNSSLELNRLKVLIWKKLLFSKRHYLLFPLLCIVPIILSLVTILLTNRQIKGEPTGGPPLTLDLDKYGNTLVYYTSVPSTTNLGQISEIYGNSLGKHAHGMPVGDVDEALINVGIDNIAKFRKQLIVAAEFNELPFPNGSKYMSLNAMYSTIPLHAAPISLNMMTDTLLKFVSGSNDYSITTVNEPIVKKTAGSIEMQNLLTNLQIIMYWWLLIPLGFSFVMAAFIYFPVTERVSNAKQLQLMTGLRAYTYWLSTYLLDFLLYLCIIFIVVFLVIALGDSTGTFNGGYELCTLFTLLFLYGCSGILYSYFLSYIRETVTGAFAFLIISNFIINAILVGTVVAMSHTKQHFWKTFGKCLYYIFSLIPHFPLSYGLLQFTQNALENSKCKLMPPNLREIICATSTTNKCCQLNCTTTEPCADKFSYLRGESGILDLLLMLALDVVIYLAILFLIEQRVFKCIYQRIVEHIYRNSGNGTSHGITDSDVQKETTRVTNYLDSNGAEMSEEDNLIVYELEKKFRAHAAVRGVSFGVHTGECFGLLGVNGAGKTTTFKMLTGDVIPTRGDAIANHYIFSQDRRLFLSQLGYCPQFDAINESLTGREMLVVFARLRGVPYNRINNEVNKWLYLLGLKDYADRYCGTYSGGNKRKLSTAMALIAEPPIVLLDEPTSGVDPISRRNVWNVLSHAQKQSIVLTSHSMEECEALCNRLVIMVNGQFKCIGTIQYLKQRFGQGFTIILKIRSGANTAQVNNLKVNIEREFTCELKDEHEGLLHYHVTTPQTSWHHLFDTIERLRAETGLIEDYTISETTLEQVFLSFARQQRNEPRMVYVYKQRNESATPV